MRAARQQQASLSAGPLRSIPQAVASDCAPCSTTYAARLSPTGGRSTALDLVKLTPLMERTSGRPEITIGLLDGPVAANHPDLTSARIRAVVGRTGGTCVQAGSAACMHGTFVAGILCARRGAPVPAICPGCTLLVRPIFAETPPEGAEMPSATPEELAGAIIETADAGAHILNLSLALVQRSSRGERELEEALHYAGSRGVITVVAAGNQGTVGSSVVTRHPWVVPIAACDLQGRPLSQSNLGRSIGRWGLSAPGENITSLGAEGKLVVSGGTSVAAPFLSGAIALLWSEFPTATAAEVRLAVTQTAARRRTTIVPPVLDAWAAYQYMALAHGRR
jgi:subtilisin family serine protease